MSNDPVLRLRPLLHHLHRELLQLLNCRSCLAQLVLSLHQLACHLLSVRAIALQPRCVRRNPLLQDDNRGVQGVDMVLDGYDKVGESVGTHEDDLFLRSDFVGVVRIALMFSEKRTYRRRSMDYCLGLQGTEQGGL